RSAENLRSEKLTYDRAEYAQSHDGDRPMILLQGYDNITILCIQIRSPAESAENTDGSQGPKQRTAVLFRRSPGRTIMATILVAFARRGSPVVLVILEFWRGRHSTTLQVQLCPIFTLKFKVQICLEAAWPTGRRRNRLLEPSVYNTNSKLWPTYSKRFAFVMSSCKTGF